MVKRQASESIIQLTIAEDDTLHALWFDVRDRGFALAPARLPLKAGTILYVMPSEFAGYCYILHYFQGLHRFGCSCKEGKQGRCCDHIRRIAEHVTR
jgi:hypothetical protein